MRPNKRLGDSNQRFSWQTISELVERLYMVLFILLKTLLKVVSATFLLVFLSKREHLWNKEKCF